MSRDVYLIMVTNLKTEIFIVVIEFRQQTEYILTRWILVTII